MPCNPLSRNRCCKRWQTPYFWNSGRSSGTRQNVCLDSMPIIRCALLSSRIPCWLFIASSHSQTDGLTNLHTKRRQCRLLPSPTTFRLTPTLSGGECPITEPHSRPEGNRPLQKVFRLHNIIDLPHLRVRHTCHGPRQTCRKVPRLRTHGS